MDNEQRVEPSKIVLSVVGSLVALLMAAFTAHTYVEGKIQDLRKDTLALVLPMRDDITTLKVQRISDTDRLIVLDENVKELARITEAQRVQLSQLESMLQRMSGR